MFEFVAHVSGLFQRREVDEMGRGAPINLTWQVLNGRFKQLAALICSIQVKGTLVYFRFGSLSRVLFEEVGDLRVLQLLLFVLDESMIWRLVHDQRRRLFDAKVLLQGRSVILIQCRHADDVEAKAIAVLGCHSLESGRRHRHVREEDHLVDIVLS